MQIDEFDAIAALIAAEIAYAKGEIKPGSTLTRVSQTYEDHDAVVTVFITTTIKARD